jgi:hypothetical protein
MPSSARWGLVALGTAIISLIVLGLSAGLHSHVLAWTAVICLLTAFALGGVASAKGRTGSRR